MKKFNDDHFLSWKWEKILFFMRVNVVLLLCSIGTLTAAPTYSQAQKFSVSYQKTSLVSVLNDLQTKTGYYFVYFDGVVPENVSVTVVLKNASLEEVLDEVLTKNGFTYKIGESVIGIGKAEAAAGQQPQRPAAVRITGTVTDAGKKPVAGASVVVKGTVRGTATDANGRFAIDVPAGSGILQVSFLGMEPQEIDITGKRELSVILAEAREKISDVVVTGIFTKPRESNTGVAPTFTAKEIAAAGNNGLLGAIRNLDPSFNITDDLAYGSDPNRLPDITMRGRTSMDVNVRDLQDDTNARNTANQPLFILDGFEVTLQRVMDMDREMVESVTLLKDASGTALYGARGANGVVVITTKRPEPGKLKIRYRGDVSVEAPDLTSYNLMNAREKIEYEKAAGLYGSPATTPDDSYQSLQELYSLRLAEVERGVDTYWLKYPVRTGIGNRHSLTLDGGADNFRYSAGAAYNNVAGVIRQSSRNTFSGNLFFQYEVKNVKFQNDLTILFNRNYNSPYGTFSDYASANPIYTPYDDEGNLKKILVSPYAGGSPKQVGNPLWNATLPYRDDGSYTNIRNNFAVEWNITPDLFVRGRVAVTKQESRSDKYLSRDHTSFETDEYSGENYKLRGSYTYGTGYDFSLEGDFTLSYSKTFAGRHQLYTGLNFNVGETREEADSIIGKGYAAVNMINLGLAGNYPPEGKPTSTEGHSRRLGSTFNVNYTYDRRYFADFSGKIEGSSKFGAGNRTAPFWSAGLGWNLHHEAFFRNVAAVNSLRLRFSYGTTGSQEFNPYQALTTYRYFLKEGYKFWNGSYMVALGNPDLGWQKTEQANAGLEAILFDRRLSLTVDFYDKKTQDLLADINLPTAAGVPSYKANVGEVRNRGIEANVNWYVIRNPRGFTWSGGGALVLNRNKILKISNALEFLNKELMEENGSNPSFLYKQGESMRTIYVVRSLGIDPATGNEIFLTRYGERTTTWSAEDKVPCGVSEPKLHGNLRTLLRWKGLTLNATFAYSLGADTYNQTLVDRVENISNSRVGVQNPWNNLDRRALHDRWRNPGDQAYFKNIADFNETYASSRFVMRENSLRLSSMNLTYEFNTEWLRRHIGFMEYLTVSGVADEVFYLSTIRRERGTSYPFARKYSFSLSTRF